MAWRKRNNVKVVSDWVKAPVDLKRAIEGVAAEHFVDLAVLRNGDCRPRKVVKARQEAARAARAIVDENDKPRFSFPQIARAMGLRNHTSVMRLVNSGGG